MAEEKIERRRGGAPRKRKRNTKANDWFGYRSVRKVVRTGTTKGKKDED